MPDPPDREPADSPRVLIDLEGMEAGPCFLAVGSLHGNEPAGRLAIERIASVLLHAAERDGFRLRRGAFLGLIGNLRAMEAERRYVDSDLNRGWSSERLQRLAARGPASAEDREMLDLHRLIERFRERATGPVHFVDLHTTSAESPPFASVADRPPDRHLVAALPVPTVLGIDTHLEGTFLECMRDLGFAGVVFEGGQHDDAVAIDHCEAATWLLMERLDLVGAVDGELVAERLEWARRTLARVGAGYPDLLRIDYRYALDTAVDFDMCPGYRSFQPVQKGQLLAHHRDREIRSHRDGLILMPLYQAQGDEGFFLMEELPPDVEPGTVT